MPKVHRTNSLEIFYDPIPWYRDSGKMQLPTDPLAQASCVIKKSGILYLKSSPGGTRNSGNRNHPYIAECKLICIPISLFSCTPAFVYLCATQQTPHSWCQDSSTVGVIYTLFALQNCKITTWECIDVSECIAFRNVILVSFVAQSNFFLQYPFL